MKRTLYALLLLAGCFPLAAVSDHYCGDLTVGDALGIERPAVVAVVPSIDGPDQVDVGKPAWYRVSGVPDGASVAFLPTPLLDTAPGRIVQGNAMFWMAKPGEYTITALVVDWSAKTFVPVTKQITVGGDSPNPLPPPVPPVPGDRWVIVVSESRDRTPQEAALLASVRRWLDQQKVNYRILDPTTEAAWAAPYKAEIERRRLSLPVLAVVVPSSKSSDGGYLAVRPLPQTSAEAIKIIQETMK